MSSTGSSREDQEQLAAHAYFRSVENAFIRLRGAPFLLSPEDWRVAQGWYREGVPVALVERVLERILGRQQTSEGGSRRIRGLRYFDGAVSAAWRSVRSMAGSEAEREAEPLNVQERITALAAAIPRRLEQADELAAEVRSLSGRGEEVETRLTALDERMVESARLGMSEEQRRELEARVEEGLEPFAERVSGEDLRVARERLGTLTLRRLLELPTLSLFSADARPPEAESESSQGG